MPENDNQNIEDLIALHNDINCAEWIRDNLEIYRHRLDGPNIPYRNMLYDLFEDHRLGRIYRYDQMYPEQQLLNSVCKAVIYNTLAETVNFTSNPDFCIVDELPDNASGLYMTNNKILLKRTLFTELLLPDGQRKAMYGDSSLYCTGNILGALIHETRHLMQFAHNPAKVKLTPQKNRLMQQMVATMLWQNKGEDFAGHKTLNYLLNPLEIDARAFSIERIVDINLSRPDRKPFCWSNKSFLFNETIYDGTYAMPSAMQKTLDIWNASVYKNYNWTMKQKYPGISDEYLIPELQLSDFVRISPVPSEHLNWLVQASPIPEYSITTMKAPKRAEPANDIYSEFMQNKRNIENGKSPQAGRDLPFPEISKTKDHSDVGIEY